MKQTNYLGLWIAILFIELAWSIAATVVCVRMDRKIEHLEEQVTYYEHRYHSCLQAKQFLRDQLNNEQ